VAAVQRQIRLARAAGQGVGVESPERPRLPCPCLGLPPRFVRYGKACDHATGYNYGLYLLVGIGARHVGAAMSPQALLSALRACTVVELEHARAFADPTFPAHQPGFVYFLHRRHEPGLGEPRTSASGLFLCAEHLVPTSTPYATRRRTCACTAASR
jgi:hypothetical protein